jgi:hypothetical protein
MSDTVHSGIESNRMSLCENKRVRKNEVSMNRKQSLTMLDEATHTTVQPAAVPPYAPYRSFRNFIDSLKQGIPSRIDRSVMPSMSGALQSQLTAALKYLGLITTSGHPTESLTKLVNSEGAERAEVLTEILKAGYPFLRKPFELLSATPRMMQEQFAKEGASGGTIDKCVNFFLSAAKDANIEVSPHLRNMRGTRVVRNRRVREITSTGANGSSVIIAEGDADVGWAQMLLAKFPSFDPAWSDEVKAKWFDGFHRLMRMKLDEEKNNT